MYGRLQRATRRIETSPLLSDEKGKALCHLSLLEAASKRLEDAKVVELAKDCVASVKKTKVDAWQISEIQLVIIGGETGCTR